jgi:hypothetical protein
MTPQMYPFSGRACPPWNNVTISGDYTAGKPAR